MTGEPINAEQFVAKWLEHWHVEWPDERAKQLINDLRRLSGDAIEFEIKGSG